jgi:hypothetical protein
MSLLRLYKGEVVEAKMCIICLLLEEGVSLFAPWIYDK